ncbi:hypothetical protein CANINC_003024 [Pichia inconspicua]|uniref:Uncharacterized protein n=1 Tax=Pichia inconspicua TaxID=52247 RepID=A0A4T0WZQ7_9ASCO|nr:hypothetical protein CANINC_003024 [[Candida] inconspicua]
MFDLIWYLLSPLTSISLSSRESKSINNTPVLKSVNIPYYLQGENEDSIVLQIKSLTYAFHRYQIANLKPFLKQNTEINDYDFDYIQPEKQLKASKSSSRNGILMNERLDEVYNITQFKKQLINDPYRILIDYSKNKFRSLLILSEDPKKYNFSEIPTLNNSNFKFLVLEPNASHAEYTDILVYKSGIYSEHRVNDKIKIQILDNIISKKLKGPGLSFNKDDKAFIIKSYVEKLAFYVQTQRIYKSSLKLKEREKKERLHKYASENTIQTYKNLKLERSKLTIKEALADENSDIANKSEYLYYSDTETPDSQASSSTSSINFSKLFTPEEKQFCHDHSRLAVRIRIERERTVVSTKSA